MQIVKSIKSIYFHFSLLFCRLEKGRDTHDLLKLLTKTCGQWQFGWQHEDNQGALQSLVKLESF